MSRVTVFISHMHEDREIANTLERIIDDSLFRGIKLFNSSNRTSISPGKLWRDTIIQELRTCSMLIAIATPESVNRPWVNFETGGAWANGKIVVPCCAKGMSSSLLPAPLNHLQAVDLTSTDDLRTLIRLIADAADLGFPSHYDFDAATERLAGSWAISPEESSPIPLGAKPFDPVIPVTMPSTYWTALLAIVQNHIAQTAPKTKARIEKLREEWEKSDLDILDFIDTLSDDDRIIVVGPILMRAHLVDKLVEHGVMKPSAAKQAGMAAIKEQFIEPFHKKYDVIAGRFNWDKIG